MVKPLFFVLCLVAGCSTKSNPNACCVSSGDCTQAGLGSITACDQGLTCVNNQCIQETCATDGCMASAPVCNAVSNACEACTESSQCANYAGQTVCDTSSGGCVECAGDGDCPANKPVCDMNACRACTADADCASGACGDDGACVAESAIVYLDPGGTDAGTCTSSMPCRSITYGVTKTSDSRPHVVMHTGSYVEAVSVQAPPTPIVYVHGGGATLSSPTGNDGNAVNATGVSIRNLTVVSDSGNGLSLTNSELRHVDVRGHFNGITVGGNVTLFDTKLEGQGTSIGIALYATDTVTLDRVTIHGWNIGLQVVNFGGKVTISNSLIYDTADLALDLSKADTSNVAFSTIADAGTGRTTGPRAVSCSTNVTFRSSIIWAPGTGSLAPLQGCNIASSIAGPAAISGVSNADPQFVNSAQHDYHVAAASPAVDFVQTGPDHDFEGDPRPKGAGYDIGADEAR